MPERVIPKKSKYSSLQLSLPRIPSQSNLLPYSFFTTLTPFPQSISFEITWRHNYQPLDVSITNRRAVHCKQCPSTDGFIDFDVSVKGLPLTSCGAAPQSSCALWFPKHIKCTMSSSQPPTERMLPDFDALLESKTKEMTRVKLLALYGKSLTLILKLKRVLMLLFLFEKKNECRKSKRRKK